MNSKLLSRELIFNRQEFKEQLDYWREVIAGQLNPTNLPLDRKRGPEQGRRRESLEITLAQDLCCRLLRFSRHSDLTLYIVLLTALKALLFRYAPFGSGEILTVSPRFDPDLSGTREIYNKRILFRDEVNTRLAFKDLLLDTKDKTMKAYKNQEYPLDLVFQKCGLNINDFPFLDQVVVLLKNIHDEAEAADLNYELLFSFEKEGEEVRGTVTYETFLFNKETVAGLVQKYIRILNTCMDEININTEIKDLEILSAGEVRQLLYDFNNTKAEYEYSGDKTICQLFEEQVASTPDNIAVVSRGQGVGSKIFLTYKELNRKSNQLGHLLREKGVTTGTVVALMLDHSIEMIVSILGILKAGGAYLPIDTDYPVKRILSILEESEASYLITSENVTRSISFTSLQNINIKAIRVKPVITAARESIKDFDSLPAPDRTLIDYEKYHQYIGIAMVRHTVALQTTRGCPYNCAYCHKVWSKTHVVRTAETIFEEIMCCYNAGIRNFVFIDDIFNLNMKNSSRLLEKIIEQKLDVKIFFPNGVRTDILTKEYIDLMIEAGTVNIAMALESASPRIQKLIRKNLNLERFEENAQYISQTYPHVITEFFILVGFPTETEQEALLTLDFLKRFNWIHFPNLFLLKIFPNTDMYDLAIENGVSWELIEQSINLAYHDVPETLPFSKSFARQFQSKFMSEYFLLKERLLDVLPIQMNVLTENELVQKYNSYLPVDVKTFSDILKIAGIHREELGTVRLLQDNRCTASDFSKNIKKYFKVKEKSNDCFKILLLDLSQLFSVEAEHLLYVVVEEPIGLMYLLTYLNEKFGNRVYGKIAKSMVDFDSFEELKRLIFDFRPDVIGIRTLSYYKEFFHRTTAKIREWGVEVPIIAGGPYATSDYPQMLRDTHVNLAVLGEGEITLAHLVGKMMDNEGRLPPEEELQNIPGIAFIKEKDKQVLKQRKRQIIFPDQDSEVLHSQPIENPLRINKANDLLYLISTSGSTGNPKSVMLEHRTMVNLLNFEFSRTGVDFDRVLQFASIGFDISAQEIFSTLLSGGQLYLIDREKRHNIPELFEFIEYNGISVLFLPPAFLKFVFEEEEYAERFPKTVKHILAAGEQLIVPERFCRYLTDNSVYLHNHYGPVETHVVTTLTMSPQDLKSERPTIGTPIGNTGIYILDKSMNLLPIGVMGELYVGGFSVGRGYLNNPEQTAEKFVDLASGGSEPFCKKVPTPPKTFINSNIPGVERNGTMFYRTGDLARWLPDGNIEFIGRIDHQVKLRGFRVELEEIERKLLTIEGIKEAVVIERQDKTGEKYLCGYIVSDRETDKHEAKSKLSRELPGYMIPSYLIEIDRIPLTLNGKVNRKALPEPEVTQGADYAAPGNETEKKIAEIWSKVLGIDSGILSINSNFFDLGGHSLKGIILAAKIHKELNIKLSLSEIFKTPTIRGLSEHIKGKQEDQYESIKPVEKKDYFPQSSAQKRLFFLDHFENMGTTYNMPSVLKPGGKFKKMILEDAIKVLIDRHEVFRMSFELIDNKPVQRIHDEVKFKVKVIKDMDKGFEDFDQKELIKKFVQPFDLSKPPLLRAGLMSRDGEDDLLLLDMHHIVTDGISIHILKREFMSLLAEEELPEMRLQYKDYSMWQNGKEQQEIVKKQEEYWLKEFAGELPAFSLPYDYPRPLFQSFDGANISFWLDEEESMGLNEISRKYDATLFMTLLSVFNILLSKLSGLEEIVIGIPTAGRRHLDLENIVGMLVNTLAFRNNPEGGKSFVEFLKEVREKTLAGFENQDYQFENLVDKIQKERDPGHNPIFDVMFTFVNLDNTPGIQDTMPERLNIPFDYENKISRRDLTLYGYETDQKIHLKITYCTELFREKTIKQYIKYFKEIVTYVVKNERIKLKDITLSHNLLIPKSENTQIDFSFFN